MVGNEVKFLKPKRRNLIEHLPFMGNGVWEDAVERRDPVGGNEEKILSKVEDFANWRSLQFDGPRREGNLVP